MKVTPMFVLWKARCMGDHQTNKEAPQSVDALQRLKSWWNGFIHTTIWACTAASLSRLYIPSAFRKWTHSMNQGCRDGVCDAHSMGVTAHARDQLPIDRASSWGLACKLQLKRLGRPRWRGKHNDERKRVCCPVGRQFSMDGRLLPRSFPCGKTQTKRQTQSSSTLVSPCSLDSRPYFFS